MTRFPNKESNQNMKNMAKGKSLIFTSELLDQFICFQKDNNRLMLDDANVMEAYVTAAIKYQPYFQLSFSSFDDTMTFSVSFFGSEDDRKLANIFFQRLKTNCRSIRS